jgi:hypothetical protein
VEIWASGASVANACNSISRADHAAYADMLSRRARDPTPNMVRPASRAIERDTGAVGAGFGSGLRCVGCERIIRIAGIHKIGTGGAQQPFDLFDGSPNYAARLAGPNLAL